jgi:ribose 5-phosphate isomerase B
MSRDAQGQRVLIASDHAGFVLKETLRAMLQQDGYEVADLGVDSATASSDYPDQAHRLCDGITAGEAPVGILICGSGVGMSIAANRHAGVRAALCADSYTAGVSRMHNNANVLCLGSRVVGVGIAEQIVRTFLGTPFEGGRHQRRIEKLEIK